MTHDKMDPNEPNGPVSTEDKRPTQEAGIERRTADRVTSTQSQPCIEETAVLLRNVVLPLHDFQSQLAQAAQAAFQPSSQMLQVAEQAASAFRTFEAENAVAMRAADQHFRSNQHFR